MIKFLKEQFEEIKLLNRSIPGFITALFAISVICMNLLANKTLVQTSWIALDAGFLISWLSFICMDIITKHFGAKASTKLAICITILNLTICGIFFIASCIKSNAADYTIFDQIFGGTWFILIDSTIAFIVSAAINNFLNSYIGKFFTASNNHKIVYCIRSYVSTAVGQFVDNLIFSILTYMLFAPIFWNGFSWTFIQCLVCSFVASLLELAMEMIFNPFSYRIVVAWEKDNVGHEYIEKYT